MLTDEAVRERMWGPFPALRRILETKAVPDRYHGSTSVSDNVFSQIERLLTMAILLHENRGEVLETLKSQIASAESRERSQLRHDLERLHGVLCWGAIHFEAAINEIEHELNLTPQNRHTQNKRDQRHGIFGLALVLSFYCNKFGELPDSTIMRLFRILNGFGSDDGEETMLRNKAKEWITNFKLDEEPPVRFEDVWG
jgi:hypothetical protein